MGKSCDDCKESSTNNSCCDNSDKKNCLSAEEVFCKYKDAVVTIQSEVILIGPGVTAPPIPTDPATRADYFLDGNGFLIKGCKVVCPASLVLIPPSVLMDNNRWPLYVDPPIAPPSPNVVNQVVRVSRIFATIYNVNGCGKSYVYELELLGVDGAGDVALLKINYNKQWNVSNPKLKKCHPTLKWGKSKQYKPGNVAYGLGYHTGNLWLSKKTFENRQTGSQQIVKGIVSDNRYVEYSGTVLPELLLVNFPAYSRANGMPILDEYGCVIGMQTTSVAGFQYGTAVPEADPAPIYNDLGHGFVSGPSEFFIRNIVKVLGCNAKSKFRKHVETVPDAAGTYGRYLKGYLGIAYELFTGRNYDTTEVYGATGATSGPLVSLNENGLFLNSPPCKEVAGIKVVGLAGQTAPRYLVPGAGLTAAVGPTLVNSPLLNIVNPGDLIVYLDKVKLGDIQCNQVAPASVTWRHLPGKNIGVVFRKGGVAPLGVTLPYIRYEETNSANATLAAYPPILDYPWYNVQVFPYVNVPVPVTNNPMYIDPTFKPAI